MAFPPSLSLLLHFFEVAIAKRALDGFVVGDFPRLKGFGFVGKSVRHEGFCFFRACDLDEVEFPAVEAELCVDEGFVCNIRVGLSIHLHGIRHFVFCVAVVRPTAPVSARREDVADALVDDGVKMIGACYPNPGIGEDVVVDVGFVVREWLEDPVLGEGDGVIKVIATEDIAGLNERECVHESDSLQPRLGETFEDLKELQDFLLDPFPDKDNAGVAEQLDHLFGQNTILVDEV